MSKGEALKWAWRIRIPSSPKVVLVALVDFANANEEQLAWPSLDCLVGRTGLHKATIGRALKVLLQLALIERAGQIGYFKRYRVRIGSEPVFDSQNADQSAAIRSAPCVSADSHHADQIPPPLLIPELPSERKRARAKGKFEHPNQLALKWPEVMEHVRVLIDDRHRFHTWFSPIAPEAIRGDTVALRVPNDVFVDYLEDYDGVLLASIRKAGIEARRVNFRAAAGSA